eukprot:CAMPEP_0119105460 /NCGR_PEP_ID=MMETSP1180-20130426/3407_1 /TAXON_ID=3052 ORGANISM="Chlamydomonas cf sp, Strain CCMP681" /NCGR_SAMPLE_ID=MMETSP1180 /ASSEMBLY_ACC=CAM_ASM_000741 /LENGTH=289 /DNA_ID=CAMNT_0007090505 /DNA_START=16 /DNA_END=885 /DNA_ORIENTATION=-
MSDSNQEFAQPASKRQRSFRTKRVSSQEPEEPQTAGSSGLQGDGQAVISAAAAEDAPGRERMEELRMLQKLRKRTFGTSSNALAAGQGLKEDLGFSRRGDKEEAVQEPTSALGGTFSKAKEIREGVDTDEQSMAKFVEEELAKRLGKRVGDSEQEDPETKRKRQEADMYLIPDEYKTILTGDTVVPGMTVVISEVPVSAAVRLQNIEQVEAMKRRLLGIQEEEITGKNEGPRRNAFIKSFGRNNLPKLTKDEMEDMQRSMKYVSERRPAVSLRQVKKAEQKQRGGDERW